MLLILSVLGRHKGESPKNWSMIIKNISRSRKNWFQPIIDQFKKEFVNLNIQLFTVNEKEIDPFDLNYVEKTVQQYVSTSMIDFRQISRNGQLDDAKYLSKALVIPNNHTIHIILLKYHLSEIDSQLMKIFYDLLFPLSIVPRPKTLVLMFDYDKLGFPRTKFLGDILNVYFQAFRLLDVTMVFVASDPARHVKIYIIYPFLNLISTYNRLKGNRIFPNKFENSMNGYPVTAAVSDRDRYEVSVLQRNNIKYLLYDLNPGDIAFLELFFCKALNCTIKLKFKRLSDPRYDVEVDFFLTIITANNVKYTHVLSKSVSNVKYAIAVPTDELLDDYNLYSLYLFMTFLCIVVTVFVWVSAFLRFPLPQWSSIKIWECLLFGSSVEIQRSKFKEVIIYTTLLTVSYIVENELVSLATDLQCSENYRPADSFHDLFHFNVTLYTAIRVSFQSNSLDDCWVQLQNMTKFIDYDIKRMYSCLRNLAMYNDRICVIPEFQLEYMSTAVKSHTGTSIRKANFFYHTDLLVVPFYKGSPYVKKFNEVVQRSFEAGLLPNYAPQAWLRKIGIHFYSVDDLLSTDHTILITSLYTTLKFGLTLSCIIFICELLIGMLGIGNKVSRVINVMEARRRLE